MATSPPVNKTQSVHSQTLNLLRFPLAIVILAIHIFNVTPANAGDVSYPVFDFVKTFIRSFLHWQSVPIYFFISGFVFFIGLRNWDKGKWLKKLHNRKKSLLIPYLVWNTLYLFLVLYSADNLSFDIKSIFSCYWRYDGIMTGTASTDMPINVPLWFLRDLMLMVIISPLLYKILKKQGKLLLAFFAVLWLVKYFGWLNIYMPAQALLFFSFGAYMSINGKDMIAEFGKYKKLSVIGYFTLGVLAMCFHNDPVVYKIIKSMLIVVGLFFAFNVAVWLLKKGYCKSNEFLASSSFFIYVAHYLVYSNVATVLRRLCAPESDIAWLLLCLTNVVLTTFILLTAYYLMLRYTPRLMSVVTGRKG